MSNHHATQEARGDKSDTSWMPMARCRDLAPEIFFPSDGPGVEVARRYCAECLVKHACLEYALRKPDPSRRVGRILRAGAAPDRQTAPED